MIKREQIESALNSDSKNCYTTKNVDHDVIAVSLLRERIPYDIVKSIICAAEHDVIYLPDIEKVLPYLDKQDLIVLADCNVCIDKGLDCMFLFI